MLKRIRIRGYKSLVDMDVALEPLCVIFGPNAAGKSNFLDALQLLSRLPTSRTLKEAFQPPYRGAPLESFTFGREGIAGLLARESVSFSLEADVELSPTVMAGVNRQIRELKHGGPREMPGPDQSGTDGKEPTFVRERYLRYRIEVEMLPQTGSLRVADEYLVALSAWGQPRAGRKPFVERKDNRLHMRMEGQAHPTSYERYLDYSVLSLPLYPPHYPHLAAVRQELTSWLFFYLEPRARMRAPNPVKEVRHIGLMGEELGSFLNTLRRLDEPQFHNLEKALHLIIPSMTGIDVRVNGLGEVELRLLEGATPIPAGVVSEGTLRVLGLLALGGAKEPPALLGLEEPENGVHPARLGLIAEFLKTRAALGDTQMIVTTQSPVLPDLIAPRFLYVCRKRDGRTDLAPFRSPAPLVPAGDMDEALMDGDEPIAVSERILRGDFDA